MALSYWPEHYWPENYWPRTYPYWPEGEAVVTVSAGPVIRAATSGLDLAAAIEVGTPSIAATEQAAPNARGASEL